MSFTNQQPWAGVAGAPDGIVMVRTANFMTLLNGAPQGVLAGQSGTASVPPDMVWDWQGKNLYVCTQSSASPLATVWTQMAEVGPLDTTNITAEAIIATGSIVDDGPLNVKGIADLAADADIGGNLTVDGTATLTGPTTVGPLTALGGGTLGGTFTGSPVFDFPLSFTQNLALANNVFITSADTTGTYRSLLGTDVNNNTYVQNSGGGILGLLNQAGTAWLLESDDGGNVQIPTGTLFVGGGITTPARVTAGSVHSTGALIIDGTAGFGGAVTTNGGLYPATGIFNIGGASGFSMVLSSGNPLLQFAGGNYIYYDRNGDIGYVATAAHNFNGPVFTNGNFSGGGNGSFAGSLTSNSFAAGYLESTGNLDVSGQLTAGSIHTPGSFAADGPSVCNSNFNIGGTTSIGGAGTVGGAGWYYANTGANHGFQLWYNGSAYVRVDNSTDVLVGTPSDARLKKNIQPTRFDGLAAIRAIPLYEFEWREGGRFDPIGFVAQEMIEAFPESVYDTGKSMGINVNIVLAALCDAVRQLAERIQ